MVDFVIITGLSGAGRTQVGNTLEDLGWFVIDNMPSELIPKVAELAQFKDGGVMPVALIVGSKSSSEGVSLPIAELRASAARVRVVFMDASTETLIRRYGESKRRHPLLGEFASVADAIEEERRILAPVRASADMIIDTTDINIHELRRNVLDLLGDRDRDDPTQVTVMSFGFKYGVPSDADMVIDCRFLPNPHWVDELRPMTGLDEPVQEYVSSFDLTISAVERIESLLDLLVPAYVSEGKSVFTVAFGCTGGRHRSVAIAEQIAAWMRTTGIDPRVRHRDVDK